MKTIKLKIDGMHCTSCSLNIDLDLEETAGIISSQTNYAKSISEISYDPQIINREKIINIIQKSGYTAS